ncbi:MAG: Bug family tripartite tricarboxylate transporter substrate binding protein [Gemmatimonas sp.]
MVVRRTLISIAAAATTVASAAYAQSPPSADEFFHGKTMTMIISTGVGGGYDLAGRLVSRHMTNHLAGAPTIVPKNMGGAGHVRAANFMAHQAPKDGTTLATIGNTIALHQVIDGQGVQYDAAKFNWIGSSQTSNINLYVWTKAGVRTLGDAEAREVILGATGAGGGNVLYPALLNSFLGTKFRVISGYGTGSDLHIAMERGEIDGRAGNTFNSLSVSNPDWIKDKAVTFLVQFGLSPEKGFESVPNLVDLARNGTERAIFRLASSPSALGWPVITAPGVPAERVAVLRRAFAATVSDPEFTAEAKKMRVDIIPAEGESLQKVVEETVATPPTVVAAAKQAIEAKDVLKGSVGGSRGSE